MRDRRLSVLVVEGDPARRAERVAWIDQSGFEPLEAAGSTDGLAHVETRPPDILLASHRLPDRSGVWLAQEVRARLPRTALVMASEPRDIETAIASLRTEAVDYLLTPFDRARLDEALALARDWHTVATGADELHAGLQERLRQRRAALAARLAGAEARPEDAVDGLVAMLQLHARDGRGHATRVARLAAALGDALGLAPDDLVTLEQGALLHDVGKIEVPASILSKPAPLDEGEWEVMRAHPQVGYDLLTHQPRLAAAADLVLSHHEAFDGKGYPRGLGAGDIPFGARILTVADAFDSMTHPHTQRPPLSPALAVDEIERCRGTQFDPACVAALGEVLVEGFQGAAHG